MPNGMYGGVRGKETKVGQKTFVSRPTRLFFARDTSFVLHFVFFLVFLFPFSLFLAEGFIRYGIYCIYLFILIY